MTQPTTEPKIGTTMPDGTIYAGTSPASTKMFALPADLTATYTFNEAQKCARAANAEEYLGHDDWRVPTKAELNVLFNNRAAIGGFDLIAHNDSDAGWYWSSTQEDEYNAWCQPFCDGDQVTHQKCIRSSVRLVRSEAPEN